MNGHSSASDVIKKNMQFPLFRHYSPSSASLFPFNYKQA